MSLLVVAAIFVAPAPVPVNVNEGAGKVPLWRCSPVHCVSVTTIKRWRERVRPHRGWLNSTGDCETRGYSRRASYKVNTGNGFFGRYQFTLGTWRYVGGAGYPHENLPLEQDVRAVKLMLAEGAGHWPVCGR
jgi:hypothetical protein